LKNLSVIIPVYNVEKYLASASILFSLEQDLAGIEVICVNDGSPDNSRAILAEYEEKI
jgi:glycosyltransferase involved in cell wall biosynthesis